MIVHRVSVQGNGISRWPFWPVVSVAPPPSITNSRATVEARPAHHAAAAPAPKFIVVELTVIVPAMVAPAENVLTPSHVTVKSALNVPPATPAAAQPI